ncbi:MAG TPA: hypothetical protein QF508_03805 [Candidatus Thalassarchaeaceae archaeon]|jgi:hypothetical protein|nr:hypothetical protein [Candidatus Thalassarchaeaceae archaeon]HJO42512.1 hypothetical protein [Candidatus Thalassarchaeaceae archaeon]|tara:strand:- start:296 stop:760 length:465 start_codon:yes stop_codon:yes gene_type:complete
MMEGNMSNSGSQMPNESNSATSMIVGTTALVLVLPAVIIALMELMNHIEYNSEFKWIIYSMVFSLTIISILLISGLYLAGLINSDNTKMGAGIYLIALSGLNLLLRFSNLNDQLRMMAAGQPGHWFEFMQLHWVHEQLELAFLGLLIGALIMKK